jgi:hypothetical protein
MPPKPNATKLWSPADMARLSGLVEAGYSIPQIAIDLGRSQEACASKRTKLTYCRSAPGVRQS